MSHAIDAELARLFEESERQRIWLVSRDERLSRTLRYRVKARTVVKPRRGMYARAEYWESLSAARRTLHTVRTLQRLHPDWIFCGPTAAVVHGLPVSHHDQKVLCIAREGAHGQTPAGIKRCSQPKERLERAVVVQGVRVTEMVPSAFDCARSMSFRRGLAIVDKLLNITGLSNDELEGIFKCLGVRCSGVGRALRAARWANALSGSAGESMARAAMLQQGFMLPQLQVPFDNPLDTSRAFVPDFYWLTRSGGVLGEFDGMAKYTDKHMLAGRSAVEALAAEKHREAALSLHRMPIVRITYRDLMDDRRLVNLLERYGVPRAFTVCARCRISAGEPLAWEVGNVLLPEEYMV